VERGVRGRLALDDGLFNERQLRVERLGQRDAASVAEDDQLVSVAPKALEDLE